MKPNLFAIAATLGATLFLAACGGSDETNASGSVDMDALLQPGPLEDMWLGDPDAPVVIVEYASMTCPHCATFHNTVFDAFIEEFVDTGEVRFVLREFPLDERAAAGFLLARCAPGEDGYYAMVSYLFETQNEWATVEQDVFLDTLFAHVQQSGFTRESFESCLANQELYEAVTETFDRGVELGVDATPTFYINGAKYPGALTLEQLREAIAAAA